MRELGQLNPRANRLPESSPRCAEPGRPGFRRIYAGYSCPEGISPMRLGNVNKLVLFGMIAVACAVSTSVQQIHFFPDFSSLFDSLQTNGSSHRAFYNNDACIGPKTECYVLRLTDGQLGEHPQRRLPGSRSPSLSTRASRLTSVSRSITHPSAAARVTAWPS
jgi:hypothetical protein